MEPISSRNVGLKVRVFFTLGAVIVVSFSSVTLNISSAALKTCNGVQVAQVANYGRQIFALQRLNDVENIRLQKAQLDLQNNTVVGNSTGIQRARIDVKSTQENINNYKSQINGVDQKKQGVLKVCKLPKEGKASSTSGTKLKKCTSLVISTLESLSSQYRTKQNLMKLNYEYMMRSKLSAARYQSLGQMSKRATANLEYSEYFRDYQEEDILATFIKQEFDALKSSCTGSGVSLPPVFVTPAEQTSNNTQSTTTACQGSNCDPRSQEIAARAEAERREADAKAAVENARDEALGKACVAGGSCKVGRTGPGGGIVFYDAGMQQSWGRYLEFAPKGWSGAGGDPVAIWCDKFPDLVGASGEKIGTGKTNTDLMLASCTSGAAAIVRAHKGGGKDDWSLPSRYELRELYSYYRALDGNKNLFGFGVTHEYWSSSEYGYVGNVGVRSRVFYYGYEYSQDPSRDLFVRPVRAF